MPTSPPNRIRDVCVLAGGPAGLACAARAAALGLDVAVLSDPAARRTAWAGKVLAHFAFPEGISGRVLLERGLAQVEQAGGEVIEAVVHDARAREEGGFEVRVRREAAGTTELTARTIILAEEPPDVPAALAPLLARAGIAPPAALTVEDTDLIGRSVLVLAADAVGIEAALAALELGAMPTLLVSPEGAAIDTALEQRLRAAGVRVVVGCVTAIARAENGGVAALTLDGGEDLAVDRLAVVPARRVSIYVGVALGVDLVEGYAACDAQRRTSVPGIYLADGGPTWRPVLDAEAGGVRAALAAWNDLGRPSRPVPAQ